MAQEETRTTLLKNKKAKHDYNIIETYEAGIVLAGCEVKSLRQKDGGIIDSFAMVTKNEILLHNLYIKPYTYTKNFQLDSRRIRKLLMHAKEIRKLIGSIKKKGQTLVPLEIYLNKRNLIKVELALVTGKKKHDKREYEKQKDWERQKGDLLKNI